MMTTNTKGRSYICVRFDGTITEHVSLDAARRAARRAMGAKTVVETRRADERQPGLNDAAGWDAYRLRGGVAS